MTLLVVVGLLVVAIAAVIIGAVASLSAGFFIGAICSGVAIVVLWRETNARREHTYVSNMPERSIPQWDRPLGRGPEDESLQPTTAELAIDGYDDLLAAEILPSLETLSVDELEAVIRREHSGLRRVSVINRAQVLIDLTKDTEAEIAIDPVPGASVDAGSIDIEENIATPKPRRATPRKQTTQRPAPPKRNAASRSPQPKERTQPTQRKNNNKNTPRKRGPDLSM